MHSGRFLRSMVHTLRLTFPFVYVMRNDSNWENDDRYTFVVAASARPVDSADLVAANLAAGRERPATQFMPGAELESWLADGDKTILTDDFAPVDGMLAPLYIQSRE